MKQLFQQKWMKIGIIALPLVVAMMGLYFFSVLPKNKAVYLEGSVEIATVPYYAQVSGKIEDVFVEAGQTIKAGDLLATIDMREIENQIEQHNATLVMKNAKRNALAKSPNTGATTAARNAAQSQVNVAKERLAAAQRAANDARSDLAIQEELFAAGTISQKELEEYKTAVAEKDSAVAIAKAELSAAQNTVNTYQYPEKNADEIDAAEADIRLTELQIADLERKKESYQITAEKDGIVISRNIQQGVIVAAGQSLFELSQGEEKYFVFYLPQEHIAKLNFGDEIELYYINGKEELGKAKVSFMDWKAVYTPKDFETSSNKNKKSIKVKAFIESEIEFGVGEALMTRLEE